MNLRMIATLSILGLASSAGATTNFPTHLAVDAYVAQQRAARKLPTPAPPPNLGPLESKVQMLVTRNDTDFAAWLHLDSFLDRRLSELAKAAKDDVYADEAWRAPVAQDLSELCCTIRRSPQMAAEIRQRLRDGDPSLPPGLVPAEPR